MRAPTVRAIPPADKLKPGVARGWNCVHCGARLTDGIPAGIARGQHGAHRIDVEVYACRGCAGVNH